MQTKSMIKKLLFAFPLFLCVSLTTHAAPNTFEVREVMIPTQNAASGMITITFDTPFAVTPLVFSLASTRGGNPCAARVSNVTLTSFDVACVESSNDGPHANMDIQYLAITPGVHAIPTSTGGTVTFEAGSIDTQTQQYNYTCPPGNAATDCVVEGFDAVAPVTPFATTPAILGQVQTLNSESAAPPGTNSEPFLTTAFRISEATPNLFGLALERSEDIDGAVTMDETIAWLAVERTPGCETLDLSAKGGPAAVNFQSIVTDSFDAGAPGDTDGFDAVDGWSNGCGANEGATFEAACFTTTPVVLANKRSRNEDDGGWLRQCAITTAGVRLTIDEDQDSDGERNHADESSSILAFGPAFTTPVTMSNASVSVTNRSARFSWQTSTETFNIGFNLWGEFAGNWVRLNKNMIPSGARDKLTPSDYDQTIRFRPKHRGQIHTFGISSLDVNGKEEFFGPFVDGQTYGEQAIPEPIDWQVVRAKYTQRMRNRGYVFSNGRWVKPAVTGGRSDRAEWLNITTAQQGIYSLSYAEVIASGLDWTDQPLRNIALSFKGQPIARHIDSDDELFNAGDTIEFLALAPKGHDALYIDKAVYQLKMDSRLALEMPVIEHNLDELAIDSDSNQVSEQKMVLQRQGQQTFYSELSPGDPWMDTELFRLGSSVEKSYSFNLSDKSIAGAAGQLNLRLAGGINFPGVTPDHHLQVKVNGSIVFDGTEDGFVDWQLELPLAADILQAGENVVTLILPADTDYPADIINIDFVELGSFEPLVWSNASNALVFPAQRGIKAYQVSVDGTPSNSYAFDAVGNISRVVGLSAHTPSDTNTVVLSALALQDQIDGVQYWLGSRQQMLSADSLAKASAINMLDGDADYLVVAHPSFIGDDLNQYVSYKQSTGLTTKVVDMSDIIEQFGFGMNTPDALRNYLVAVNRANKFTYLLLVGGHSYDYLNYLNQDSVSFIPTWYRPVDLIQYGPTDTPYIELNGDGKPDKAIGRWPVRTLTDLQNIIRKTMEWDSNQMSSERSALLIAEQNGGNKNFAQQLDGAVDASVDKWSDVSRVYLDEVFSQDPAGTIADARQSIVERINQGVGLTMFNGHGSPSSWTYQSLVSWQHLQQLENHGKPTVVMPLACYTTYYETPSVNSLAHQWLFFSNSEESQGAVAIHGAMVLGKYRENAKFAERLLQQQLNKGKTIGQGILAAKRSLTPWNQMVNNWALLGDPTLRVGQ